MNVSGSGYFVPLIVGNGKRKDVFASFRGFTTYVCDYEKFQLHWEARDGDVTPEAYTESIYGFPVVNTFSMLTDKGKVDFQFLWAPLVRFS